jgi:hypothetical protein
MPGKRTKIHTPKGDGGLHYHLQLVPPLHPDPINFPDSIPPECKKPEGCGAKE